MITNEEILGFAEQLHIWYLEATQKLNPNSFNKDAQKPYSELTDEQKFIDKYIAEKAISLKDGNFKEFVENIKEFIYKDKKIKEFHNLMVFIEERAEKYIPKNNDIAKNTKIQEVKGK